MTSFNNSLTDKVKILVYFIVFIFILMSSFVYASDESFDLNLVANTNSLVPGSTLSLDMQLSNINVTEGEGGIAGFTAKLVYEADIFEDVSVTAKNSKWNVTYSEGLIVAYREDTIALNNSGLVEDGNVGTIKMKVKKDATETKTKIKLDNIQGGDTEHTVVGNTNELEIDISDSGAALKNIEISSNPTKLTYTEGEKFDKTGLELLANYEDGSSSVIDNYTYTPSEELSVKDEKITISYTENSVTKEATINIKVNAKNNSGDNTINENIINNTNTIGNTTVNTITETNTTENIIENTSENTNTEVNTNQIADMNNNTNVNTNTNSSTSKNTVKSSNTDNSIASKILPKTGKAGMALLVVIVTIVLIMSIVGYRKYRGI